MTSTSRQERATERGTTFFDTVLRGYDTAGEDATHAFQALRSVFQDFASLQMNVGFQWVSDIDTSFDKLTDHGLHGEPHADTI